MSEQYVVTKFEFSAENELEMDIQTGDVIRVVKQEDEGWWEGENLTSGKKGLFPTNYTEPCDGPEGPAPNPVAAASIKLRPSTSSSAEAASLIPSSTTNNNNNTTNVSAHETVDKSVTNTTMQSSTVKEGQSVHRNTFTPQHSVARNSQSSQQPPLRTNDVRLSVAVSQQPSSPLPQVDENETPRDMQDPMMITVKDPGGSVSSPTFPSRTAILAGTTSQPYSSFSSPSPASNSSSYAAPLYTNSSSSSSSFTSPSSSSPAIVLAATTAFVPSSLIPPPPAANTCYGVYSRYLAMTSSLLMLVLGIANIVFYEEVPCCTYADLVLYSGIYAIGLSVVVFPVEFLFGMKRGSSPYPLRGFIYLLLSGFMFVGKLTIVCGGCLLFVALFNFMAVYNRERYDYTGRGDGTEATAKSGAAKKEAAAPKVIDPDEVPNLPLKELVNEYFVTMKQQNQIGRSVFVSIYFVVNVIIFGTTVKQWQDNVNNAPANSQLSNWAPWAKGFGHLLDLNCAIIVLPVCRTLLRHLYNFSTADQSVWARALRAILYFVPLDHALSFHRLIAKVILFSAAGHIIVHVINYSLRPSQTMNSFGLWPWVTGGLLLFVMYVLYSATFERVIRGQFEIFWYAHHMFLLFFFFLLIHGAGGLGPNYWKFFLGPGTLYLGERLLRVFRARQKVVLLSVALMDDVLSLEIAKEGVFESPYSEGQYIFLQVPSVSQVQWHPFTISSAPEEESVTVHIRVLGEGTWTRKVRDYVAAMGPARAVFFPLHRQGPSSVKQGKLLGPDGEKILCIDGPHSAPTQHVSEYVASMIIGAGIGTTPVAATLKSIVFHKWKFNIGKCYPERAYLYWVCGHKDISAFRWLIRTLREAQDEILHQRQVNPGPMALKRFEVHIYVTSAPKDLKASDVRAPSREDIGFWGPPRSENKLLKTHASWDEAALYRAMMCPPSASASEPIVLDDIRVYGGRPNWKQQFEHVHTVNGSDDVGVAFCGNPVIATDLKRMCYLMNQTRTKGLFRLHKENF